MTTQTTKEFDKLRAQVEKKLDAKVKPKPRMEKASGPFSTRVWHINAPKGMVIDEVLYGEGGTVVTIAYRVKGADE